MRLRERGSAFARASVRGARLRLLSEDVLCIARTCVRIRICIRERIHTQAHALAHDGCARWLCTMDAHEHVHVHVDLHRHMHANMLASMHLRERMHPCMRAVASCACSYTCGGGYGC